MSISVYFSVYLCICCAAPFSVLALVPSRLSYSARLRPSYSARLRPFIATQRHGPVQSSLARYDTTRYYAFHALSLYLLYHSAPYTYPAHAGLFHRTSAFGSPFSCLLSFPFQYAAARRLLCLMPYVLPYASLTPPSQPPKNKKKKRAYHTNARAHTRIYAPYLLFPYASIPISISISP